MNYWKKIKIKNLEIIQTKSLEYIKNNKDQFSLGASFQPIKFDDFIKAVPEIMDAFTDHGLTPKTVAAYFMLTNTDGGAHRDSYTDPARINIPILNCENSWTNFYVLKDSSIKPKLMLNKKGQPYKLIYKWNVRGKPGFDFVKQMYPFFCERRKKKLRECYIEMVRRKRK